MVVRFFFCWVYVHIQNEKALQTKSVCMKTKGTIETVSPEHALSHYVNIPLYVTFE